MLPIDTAVYHYFQGVAFYFLPVVTKHVFSMSETMFNSLAGQCTGINCLCKVPVLLDVILKLSYLRAPGCLSLVLSIQIPESFYCTTDTLQFKLLMKSKLATAMSF